VAGAVDWVGFFAKQHAEARYGKAVICFESTAQYDFLT